MKFAVIVAVGLLCLCTLVSGCEPRVSGRWYTQSQVESGKIVYVKYCVSCHHENAQGTTSWKERGLDGNFPPPPLNGSAHAWHHPLTLLQETIHDGGIPFGGKMPAFGTRLNEKEERAVISYFQSFWTDDVYREWLKRGGLNQ